MIPVLIGAAVIAGGAGLIFGGSDKKDKKSAPKKVAVESSKTFTRVKKIIAEQLDLTDDEVKISSKIVEDLGANFQDKVIIFDLLEEEFGVEFSGENFKTVEDIVNYIIKATPFALVKKIIAEQLDLADDEVKMSSRIVEDLGANFQDKVIIFDLLEEEFGVKFSGENFKTVEDIVNYIKAASENTEPAQKTIAVSQFKDKDVTVEKREVSEEYVLRQLSRHNGTINF